MLALVPDEPEWDVPHRVRAAADVQCRWALLPLFLTVARAAGRPLELLELGCSAGLNLYWDRYRYVYDTGFWGASNSLLLAGEQRAPVPADLLDEHDLRGRRYRLAIDGRIVGEMDNGGTWLRWTGDA